VRITFLGHAGLYIETHAGSVLCDPWFNPAYFASWFPFPSNEDLDRSAIGHPDYLFISHLHHDHFDPEFLRAHVSKETTVILPDYPLDLLERALRGVGFNKFLKTKNYQPIEDGGLRFITSASVAPTDGPLGDCGLVVDDSETRIYDQNDSRPVDLDRLVGLGPYDVHFLQFSGAIWFPMVYQFPGKMKETLGHKKRANEMERALRYTQEVGATFVVPHAGPPCFLDDDLFYLNDFDRDPVNTFPDQTVFLEYLRDHGRENGRLMIPGSVATLTETACEVTHPLPEDQVAAIFGDKRAYLEAYQARQRPRIQAIKASWPRGQVEILPALKEWLEPLMETADILSVGINGLVVLDCGEQKVTLDFHRRQVYAYEGQEWDYYFRVDPALVESEIVRHQEDWINDLFLSCRFEAERKGAYNEYVYTFFKCLTTERQQYAEGYYADQSSDQQFFESHGYRIQRRCPHLKGDLARFGHIEDGILTCMLHGWQFELATGRCLTSDDRRLHAKPLSESADAVNGTAASQDTEAAGTAAVANAEPNNLIRQRCHDCWYNPAKRP
jgi:UDP-MurNAc hydroxylase